MRCKHGKLKHPQGRRRCKLRSKHGAKHHKRRSRRSRGGSLVGGLALGAIAIGGVIFFSGALKSAPPPLPSAVPDAATNVNQGY